VIFCVHALFGMKFCQIQMKVAEMFSLVFLCLRNMFFSSQLNTLDVRCALYEDMIRAQIKCFLCDGVTYYLRFGYTRFI